MVRGCGDCCKRWWCQCTGQASAEVAPEELTEGDGGEGGGFRAQHPGAKAQAVKTAGVSPIGFLLAEAAFWADNGENFGWVRLPCKDGKAARVTALPEEQAQSGGVREYLLQ